MIKNAPDMKVRLSATLRQKVESAARQNNRTMNAEIAVRLEQSFREERQLVSSATALPNSDQEKRLSSLEKAVIGIIFDDRWDQTADRLAALEKRLSDQST
jgi:hypothetical protein